MLKIAIINGPNLNLTGVREPTIYGSQSFEDFIPKLKERYTIVEITYFQSNVEGEIINEIQSKGFDADGIILNAGAYTHTSIAIADAVKAITTPVIEVHLSAVLNRESFRHVSFVGANCIGTISGFGFQSYVLALEQFIHMASQ